MNKRKDQLRSLFGMADAVPDAASPPATPAPTEARTPRTASGAVKAMGLSLGALSDELEDARRLRDSLGNSDAIVELDPDRIERSPYIDRMSDGAAGDESFEALKESVREHGQQVPILVRPHPDATRARAGWFQAAYGHRRLEAARQLGGRVKAIVKPLTDDQLAIAQGKENAERRDLSFIERAFFAAGLVRHGFDRATIGASLAVHKTEMVRLLQVAEAVPESFARAIGPAPKAGRPRWLELGELLKSEAGRAKAVDEMSSKRFQAASSDERFQMMLARLSRRPQKEDARQLISGGKGETIGELKKRGDFGQITIPPSAGQGFADFVAAELPRLHAAFAGRLAEQDQ